MGVSKCLLLVGLVLFLWGFACVSAMDMSIISYDEKHGMMGVPDRSEGEMRSMYQAWLAKHGKAYNGLDEHEKRFEIFKDNLKFVDQHNAGNSTFRLGLNKFADLSNEEYRRMYLGTKTDAKRRFLRPKSDRYRYKQGEELPGSVDWREKGAVAPVKDQGSCGMFKIELERGEWLFRSSLAPTVIWSQIHSIHQCISNIPHVHNVDLQDEDSQQTLSHPGCMGHTIMVDLNMNSDCFHHCGSVEFCSRVIWEMDGVDVSENMICQSDHLTDHSRPHAGSETP